MTCPKCYVETVNPRWLGELAARSMTDELCDLHDYREIFGRDPEPWREPLGALRLTLAGDPDKVDVKRAQYEIEELVKVLNGVNDGDR